MISITSVESFNEAGVEELAISISTSAFDF